MSAYRTPGEPGASIVDDAGDLHEARPRCAEPEHVAGGRITRRKPCPLPWNWFFRFNHGDKFECDCGRVYRFRGTPWNEWWTEKKWKSQGCSEDA